MREVDSKAFGRRVRGLRRDAGWSQTRLGEESGYSQQNILTIEKGRMKRPERCAAALAAALGSTRKYLLYEEGPRRTGPRYFSDRELVERYKSFSPKEKVAITQAMELIDEKRDQAS